MDACRKSCHGEGHSVNIARHMRVCIVTTSPFMNRELELITESVKASSKNGQAQHQKRSRSKAGLTRPMNGQIHPQAFLMLFLENCISNQTTR